MPAKFIPPRDPRQIQLEKARGRVLAALEPYIAGERLQGAVEDIMGIFEPIMKLPSKPDKGATVMTEAATRNDRGGFTKGPSNL